MFLTLLVVTQTVAEWVEISQQHYRKPMHTYSIHNPFKNPDKIEVEETTKTWGYSNKSVSEHLWNNPSMIQSSIEHIKKVNFNRGDTKFEEDENEYFNANGGEFDQRPNYEPTRPTVDYSDNVKHKGTIEKVSNVGNVKRVQLSNSPVKSPGLKRDSDLIAKNRYEEFPLENESFSETKSNTNRIYVNNIRNRFSSETSTDFPTDSDESSITEITILRNHPKPEIKSHINKPKTSSRVTPITKTENLKQKGKYENAFRDGDSKTTVVNKNRMETNTEHTNINEAVTGKVDKELYMQQSSNRNGENNDSNIHKVKNVPETVHNNITDFSKNENKIHKPEHSSYANQINGKDIDSKDINMGQNKEKKVPTKETNSKHNMENLLKFLKVVADTISRNTKRSVKGKMSYLHELKHAILDNIAERIDATWPDDDVTTNPHRSSRSTQASARGHHVQFPSSESALMTISFLTFAVFLVKLVLQIIQTYKNKTMMVAPVLVSSGARTLFSHRGTR